MVGQSKKSRGKHRLDKYYHLAKEQGYRSRAAFKLIQLNKKHGFLTDAKAVLDLCAAPGGWLQVCAKHMPMSARIIGVDLVPIKPVRGALTITEDITSQGCRERLRKESAGSLFDVVLHDGAPNVGGAFATEMYTQSALVLDSLRLAADFLRPGGTFVTKVFRSRDYTALLYAFRQLFARVDATKPQASRATSTEIFVVCSGYKAPAKIDPRLLDHRTLFQDLEEPARAMGPDALLKSIGKKHRHRTGYAEGVSMIARTVTAVEFVRSSDPMPMLGSVTAIHLKPPAGGADGGEEEAADGEEGEGPGRMSGEEASEVILEHPDTDAEVRALCADVQVLGRSEFKQLLRWRMKIRKALERMEKERAKAAEAEVQGEGGKEESGSEADGDAADGSDGGEGEAPASAEEVVLREMEALRAREVSDAKRTRKKRRELKKRAKIRLAQAAAVEGIGEEVDEGEEAMFRLDNVRGAKGLAAVGERDVLDVDEVRHMLDAPDSGDELASVDGSSSDDDGEKADARYEGMVEEYLDRQYESYLQRRHARDAIKAEKQKRSRLAEAGIDGEEGDAVAAEVGELPSRQGESDSDGDDAAGGGLLVSFDGSQAGRRKMPSAIAQQWFAQDVFKESDLLTDDDEEVVPAAGGAAGAAAKRPRAAAMSDSDTDGDSDDSAEPHAGVGVLTATAAAGGGPAAGPSTAAPAALRHQTRADPHPARAAMAAPNRQGGAAVPEGATSDSDGGAEAAGDSGDEEGEAIARLKGAGARLQAQQSRAQAEASGLEVVAQDRETDGNESSDTDDEFAGMDEHAQAEVRALARRWLRGRKDQLSLMDAAYNRYSFDDAGAAPKWLQEDEGRHMKPAPLVARDEVAAEREALRAIDARPLKKVAEAKARKKRRVSQKLAVARGKAEAIVDVEDMSVQAKAREIGKLYSKAKAAGRDRRAAAAGKSDNKLSRSARATKARKGPPLDRRMIADKMKGAAKAKNTGRSKGKKGRR